MTHRIRSIGSGTPGAVSATLFLCLFAAQAGLIALSPLLIEVARDLDVSTAVAGQLRTITGLAAGLTALLIGRVGGRVALERQLVGGTALLALGSLASAGAPSLALLAAAQTLVGVGVAALTTAATVAAAEWVAPEYRTRVLSWALIGQPVAWIVGMPLVGLVGEHSWRYGLLALPLAAAVLAAAALAARRRSMPAAAPTVPLRSVLANRGLARWLTAELLANTAWAGTLVYSGALFVDSYGTSPRFTGVLLAIAAGAYVAGNLAARHLAPRDSRSTLATLALVLATTGALLGTVRPSVLGSTILFSTMAAACGGRTLVSSSFGLAAARELRPAVMGMRAATMQFGYFAGSSAAGAALALGGFAALGLAIALLFVLSAAVVQPGIGCWTRFRACEATTAT